jgi:PadR family transcriptional regulator, regulatory protein PadR
MRRKPGSLLPLEIDICVCAAEIHRAGADDFHGYDLAKTLAAVTDRKSLTAYGTLYRALSRLEEMRLLQSRWENPMIAARENRPVRRLYTLTKSGDAVARDARNAALARAVKRLRKGWAT